MGGRALRRENLAVDGRGWPIVLGAAIGLVAAAVAVASPLAAVGFAVAATVVLLVAIGSSVVPLFQVALATLLVGYAFLNKGFAYVGVGSVYVGELVVAIGLLATAYRLGTIRIGVAHVAILAFMAWGAIRTIPYVGIYGVDALRDGVAWAYALIALAVAATVTMSTFRVAIRWYGRLIPALVLWFPIAAFAGALFGNAIPTAPGTDVPIIYFKAGDAGVHLAGVGAFILSGLYAPAAGTTIPVAFVWAGWLTSAGLVAAVNRGGMLAASMCALSLLFVRRLSPWLIAGTVGLAIMAGGWIINPQVNLGIERTLSFQQITENVTSIFGESSTQTESTKEWRLRWWEGIVDYTINGPYFWDGKGYGVNLADSDGFQVEADGSLRSPHSAHFEILARSGVPGLALWIAVQLAVWFVLFRAARRARQRGATWWLAVAAWLGVYWLANLVNMSFDVYLVGPMGGIWFWAVVGAIIALDRVLADGDLDLDSDTSESQDRSRYRRRVTPST
jgi:O-antigen ligase/polysaccharide polymerase Wzy-like membrane protein